MRCSSPHEKCLHPLLGIVECVRADAAIQRRAFDDGAREKRDSYVGGHATKDAVERAELQPCRARPTELSKKLFKSLPIRTADSKYKCGRPRFGRTLSERCKACPSRCSYEHQLFPECRRNSKLGMIYRAANEGSIERTVQDRLNKRGCRRRAQRQLDRWEVPMESGEHWRQAHGRCGFHGADRQRPSWHAVVARCRHRFSRHHRQAFDVGQQPPTCSGQRHAPTVSVEQGASDFCLKGLDTRRHVRLHRPEFARRSGNAAAACDGCESREVLKVHRQAPFCF